MKIKLWVAIVAGLALIAVGYAIRTLTHQPEAVVKASVENPQQASQLQSMVDKATNLIK